MTVLEVEGLRKAYGGQISLLKGVDAAPVEAGNEAANEPV